MKCQDIMKTHVQWCHEMDSVAVVAARMREEGIGFMPVCDVDGALRGTVTDRDLTIRVLALGRPLDTPVRSVMSHGVITCNAEDDLGRAEALMARYRKSRMVCADDLGHPLGVISLSDIAEVEHSRRASRIFKAVAAREART